jgi:hypothetical protein
VTSLFIEDVAVSTCNNILINTSLQSHSLELNNNSVTWNLELFHSLRYFIVWELQQCSFHSFSSYVVFI